MQLMFLPLKATWLMLYYEVWTWLCHGLATMSGKMNLDVYVGWLGEVSYMTGM